ncbi:hypothetical protein ACMYR3_07885 [Ampullimonas aquatilis]|uniref:hypothetical protein n=1 Tax=Ampullimonas aquatilis TaxID=1341549 RepID=UPI003C77E612
MTDSAQHDLQIRSIIFLIDLLIFVLGYWALKKKWQIDFLFTQVATIAFAIVVAAFFIITVV